MAQHAFGPIRWTSARRKTARRKPLRGPDEMVRLSSELPRGVAAILRPHLSAALLAYPAQDQTTVLAAYGVGCAVLADLLSQTKGLPAWKNAGAEALQRLLKSLDPEAWPESAAVDVVAFEAAWLENYLDGDAAYLDVCLTLSGAVVDLMDARTLERGAVTLKAAMARLEAMAFAADRPAFSLMTQVEAPAECRGLAITPLAVQVAA